MKYRADIQGLRALAIIPVVLFHADKRLMPGGFIGVDVFFVISGFLITSLIVNELETGRFSLGGFYQRRVRRLFPALYAMLGFSFLAAALLLPPWKFREFGVTALSTVFFVSNFKFAELSGYFGAAAEVKPLLHTWSLAVEEQFYIVFPLVLMAMRRRFWRYLPFVLSGCAVLSLAYSVWAVTNQPTTAFFLAPPRAFELLIGALAACRIVPAPSRQIVRDLLSWLGLGLIVGSAVLLGKSTPFPGLWALPPCLGAALIIYAGQDGVSAAGRLLSARPATLIGSLSYSLYLWHWPFLVFGYFYFLGERTPLQTAGLVLASVAASALCWRFVEQPFLRGSFRIGPTLLVGLAVMAAGAAASGVVIARNGLSGRFSPEVVRLFDGGTDYNHRRRDCHSDVGPAIPYDRNCLYGQAGVPPDLAVWGDSYGAELVQALGERVGKQGRAAMQITASACPPAMDYAPRARPHCAGHNTRTLERLAADDRIRTVWLVASYGGYEDENWTKFASGLAQTARTLAGAGKQVVLVYPIPVIHQPPEIVGLRAARGGDPADHGLPLAEHARRNRRAVALLDDIRKDVGAAAVEPSSALCPRGMCVPYRPDAGLLYYNDNHMSVTGARLVVARLPEATIGAVDRPVH